MIFGGRVLFVLKLAVSLRRRTIHTLKAKILTLLPKAAATYLKLIEEGLAGDARSAAKVRLILKDMLGPISLSPGEGGSLWAAYYDNPWALVRDAGFHGRGGRI